MMFKLIVNCIVGGIFFALVLAILIIKKKADAEYEEYISILDEKVFPLKNYFNISQFTHIIPHRGGTIRV